MGVWRLEKTAAAALSVVAALAVLVRAADLWKDIGMTEADAKRGAVSAFTNGYVPIYPANKAFKAAAPAMRVALVKGVLTFVKAYAEGPEFAQAYLKERERARPAAPAMKSGEEEWAKLLKDLENGIANMKKSAADPALAPEVRKTFEQMIPAQVQQYEQMKANAQMKQIMVDAASRENAAGKADHEKRTAEWERKYPADPRAAVAAHLRRFLDVSATVDYGAPLTKKGTRQVFANAKYESQTSDWKLCYRAGKETVDAARAFVTGWLAQLPK